MAILRPYYSPFITPQPVQLLSRLPGQQIGNQTQDFLQPQTTAVQQPQQQFEQTPFSTQDNISRQLDNYRQSRQMQFQPTPQANNPTAATATNPITNFLQNSSVRPNFQTYFNRLQSIEDTGVQATAVSKAKASFNSQQSFNALGNANIGANTIGGFDSRVSVAKSLIGVPYVWGHQDKNGTDCSGLIYQVLNATGIKVPRLIASQYGKMGTAVSLTQAVPGDVVYFDNPGATDHVGIYIGNGKMIDAPFTGARVRVDNVGSFTSIRRIGTPKTGTTPTGISGGLGASPTANRQLGHQLIAQAGLGGQWGAFDSLVNSESGWNNRAQNPKSTAYGIGQFLDSTWRSYGKKTSDPKTQILNMIKYVLGRYGSPANAWRFKQQHGWY